MACVMISLETCTTAKGEKRYLHPERWYIAGAAHPLTPGPRQVHASRDVTDPRGTVGPHHRYCGRRWPGRPKSP